MRINSINSVSNLSYKGGMNTAVKISKGIATQGGELFTGVTEKINAKGNKVILEFVDGFLEKSFVDGEPVKMYSQVEEYAGKKIARGKAVQITDFAKGTEAVHTFYKSGKLSKIMKEGAVTEFSQKGNKVADYTVGKNPYRMLEGKIYFDEPGAKVRKTIKHLGDGEMLESVYNKNGVLRQQKRNGFYHFDSLVRGRLSDKEMQNSTSLKLFNKGGLFEKEIATKNSYTNSNIQVSHLGDTFHFNATSDIVRTPIPQHAGAVQVGPKMCGAGGVRTLERPGVYYMGSDADKLGPKDFVRIGRELQNAIKVATKERMHLGTGFADRYMGHLDQYISDAQSMV